MTLYEKESIITYNEGEATADIYTYDPKLIIKLERLSKKYPDKIIHERNEPEGGVSYTVPKECIVVREPYSDTIRQAARERAIQGGFKPPNRDSGPIRSTRKCILRKELSNGRNNRKHGSRTGCQAKH